MQASERQVTLPAGNFPWVVFISGVGWAVSGLVFFFLAPLQGSLATVSLVMALLFLLPGFIVIALLRLTVSSSPWGVLAASFGVGSGIVLPLAFIGRLLGLPLAATGQALWVLELPLILLLFAGWRRGSLVSFQFSARSKRAKQADWILLALLVPVIGGYLLEVQYAIPLGGPADWPKYLNYVSWVLANPQLQALPPIHAEWQANFRVWWAAVATITDLVKINTTVLDVHWRYVPPMLIALSVVAVYALACELFDRPGARVASVTAQVVYLFAGLPGAFAGHTEWVGYTVFYTISQDKVLLSYVMAPVFALLALRYLRTRERATLLLLGLSSVGAVLTHPLGFPFIALVAGTYGLLNWIAHPTCDVRPYIALIIITLPLLLFPLIQRLSRTSITSTLSAEEPVSEEDPTSASRDSGNNDRLLILSREQNDYIASPQLIQYPITMLGTVIGLGLALHLRKSRTARFLFGMTLAPMLIIYTPRVAPAIGSVIGYDTFWRFIWLLPTSLAIGWGFDNLAHWMTTRLGNHRRAAAALATAGVVLTAFWGLGLARDLPDSVFIMHTPNDGGERYRENLAISAYVAKLVEKGQTILAPVFPSQTNRTIFAVVPDVQVVSWHRNSNVALHDEITRFYAHTQMDPTDVDLLQQNKVDYIVIPQNAPIAPFMSAAKFEQVGSVESVNIYRTGLNLDYIFFDPAYVRDDYHALAKQIIEESGPEAVVLLDKPGPDEAGHWKALQEEVVRFFNKNYPGGPKIIPLSNDTVQETLTSLLNEQERLYAIFWGEGMQDPERAAERMLNASIFETSVNWYGRMRLVRYEQLGESAIDVPSGAQFGSAITLKAFALTSESLLPGGVLGVRLLWQTDSQLPLRYKVFVHLIGPDGTLTAQHDSEPGGSLAPTDSWKPGETIIDNHTLVLPPDARPGTYQLWVGLYAEGGERLSVTQGGEKVGDQLLLRNSLVK